MNNYKKYEICFTENKRYNPSIRTVTIHALNPYHAEMLVHQEFGTFTSRIPQLKPSSKIRIDSCVEIVDEAEETIDSERLVNA